ncbi:protealysin inhibitor emfourin [Amnibacterium flavum]|uniref:Uncharacterized protein n=1 Tax=Amnibacterium flavum TaxID=2173173 RepID=A0A2V1HW84_9MICO|nr:protealysin inhibitor emfourin [Amnibacterium flavum]PVZ94707.1 hypothetical protein DDQ50_13565 [Amnibacterium flavum]
MTTVVVHIVRSGGVTAIRREWTVSVDAAEWARLLDDCPAESAAETASRDRYVWRVTDESREVVIPDSALAGDWRALVDRARHGV